MTKTDAASFEVLAENYRGEADVCRQMAATTGGSQKEEWLRLSAEWIGLAKEADANVVAYLNAGHVPKAPSDYPERPELTESYEAPSLG